jgi:formylglycine-generating enzyme required for sulfatase activity
VIPVPPSFVRFLLLAGLFLLTTGCVHSQDRSTAAEEAPVRETGESAFQAGDVREVTIPGTRVVLRLVWVPGGTYRIGTGEEEAGRETDEGPITPVALSGYWIGQTEVTDDAFNIFRFPDRDSDTTAVAGAIYDVDAVSRPSPPYEDPAFGMGGEGKPAVGMTQWGALHFAKWLTDKTGVFFRLPTEAEWEVACRAGQDPETMRPLSGAMLDRAAWFEQNSGMKLQDVGSKRANAWQIHDMLGNAAEWMLDEYMADYHALVSEMGGDPWIQPTRLHPRTVRGGSFDEGAAEMRCGARLESTTDWKRRDPQIPKSFWWNTDSPFLGFRLVAPAERPSPEDEELFWTLVLGE